MRHVVGDNGYRSGDNDDTEYLMGSISVFDE